MTHVDICLAGVRDLFSIRRLQRSCFGTDAWGLLELCFSLLTASVRLKAVSSDGRLVGFTLGEANSREGVIAIIGVHPEYQRRGIGRQLLGAAEARLRTPLLKLTVRASNFPAIALYTHCGYNPVNRIARYYPGGEDGIVMEKRRP